MGLGIVWLLTMTVSNPLTGITSTGSAVGNYYSEYQCNQSVYQTEQAFLNDPNIWARQAKGDQIRIKCVEQDLSKETPVNTENTAYDAAIGPSENTEPEYIGSFVFVGGSHGHHEHEHHQGIGHNSSEHKHTVGHAPNIQPTHNHISNHAPNVQPTHNHIEAGHTAHTPSIKR